jgi:hypothetical protein
MLGNFRKKSWFLPGEASRTYSSTSSSRRQPQASGTCSATPGLTSASRRRSSSGPRRPPASWTQLRPYGGLHLPFASFKWGWGRVPPGCRSPTWSRGTVGGSALHVENGFQNFQVENKLSKRWKTDYFFILMPERNFLTELTFSTYPHKFQNLSFNLVVIFFLCSQGLWRYHENKWFKDFRHTLYVLCQHS